MQYKNAVENSYTLYTPHGAMVVSPDLQDIINTAKILIEHEKARKQTRVYIAGPMTGVEHFNHPAFHKAAATLRQNGYTVINPAEINPDTSATWLECMRRDIKCLVECDAITLLPNWEMSRGASLEVYIARMLGMQIIKLDQLEVATA